MLGPHLVEIWEDLGGVACWGWCALRAVVRFHMTDTFPSVYSICFLLNKMLVLSCAATMSLLCYYGL